jgi:DNA-directed RNA polymerase subunit RPC12/RpoP
MLELPKMYKNKKLNIIRTKSEASLETSLVCRKCGAPLKIVPESHDPETKGMIGGYPSIWCPECGLPQWKYLEPRPSNTTHKSLVEIVTGWKPLSAEDEERRKSMRPREAKLNIRIEVAKTRSSRWPLFIQRTKMVQNYYVSSPTNGEIHTIESTDWEDLRIVWNLIKSWNKVNIWINDRAISRQLAGAYVWREEWNDNEDVHRLDYAYIDVCPNGCGEVYRKIPNHGRKAYAVCQKCGFTISVIDTEFIQNIDQHI